MDISSEACNLMWGKTLGLVDEMSTTDEHLQLATLKLCLSCVFKEFITYSSLLTVVVPVL